jgi:hypothetical protein
MSKGIGFGRLILISTIAVFGTAAALAKDKPSKNIYPLDEPAPMTTGYSPEAFEKTLAHVKEIAKRDVAQATLDNRDESVVLSEQYRNIRNSLIGGDIFEGGKKKKTSPGATNSQHIVDLLADLEKGFKAGKYTSPDARVLAAQLLMLKPYQGFVYRARNIFDTSEGKARAAHAAAITMLRIAAAGVDTYFPTDQWKAGFDYTIEPFYVQQNRNCDTTKGWSSSCDIHNGETLQVWMRRELLPQLEQLGKVLHEVRFEKPVYWDNQILYGTANFTSSRDRLLRLGEPERYLMMSAVQAAISSVYGMSAFSFDGFFESIDDISKVYGFQQVFNSDGATARERFGAITKHDNLFKFKKNDPMAKKYMNNSYAYLKTSLQNAHFAWKLLEGRENNKDMQDNLIDPRAVAPFARILNTGFSNAFGIAGLDKASGKEVADGEVVSAVVNGEKVIVHLKEFYNNPPDSLQDFMPNNFEGGSRKKSKPIKGTNVEYRNYDYGRPAQWQYGVYSKYFEGVQGPNDVKRIARVLSQSWGGFLLGVPIGMVMF